MTLASFRRWNPEWEMQLYTPTLPCAGKTWNTIECDDMEYAGPDYNALVESLEIARHQWKSPVPHMAAAPASDLFSYDYLSTIGGWYSDMDILWCRPMIDVAAKTDVVLCKTANVFAVGLMASSGGSPFWGDVFRLAGHSYRTNEYQSCGVLVLDNHIGKVDSLDKRYPAQHVVVLPDATVYPWDYRQTHRIFSETNTVPENSTGIHWFGGHPNAQRWNNRLTADNCRDYDNTFCTYAQRALNPCTT
jgi:hypothetical protein